MQSVHETESESCNAGDGTAAKEQIDGTSASVCESGS